MITCGSMPVRLVDRRVSHHRGHHNFVAKDIPDYIGELGAFEARTSDICGKTGIDLDTGGWISVYVRHETFT